MHNKFTIVNNEHVQVNFKTVYKIIIDYLIRKKNYDIIQLALIITLSN